MSLLNLTVKHGRTLDEARAHLQRAVSEIRARFGTMIHRVEWGTDGNAVKLFGPGVEVAVLVDAQEVHATVDAPLLGGLLASPLLAGLKGILQENFSKPLPPPAGGKSLPRQQ
jgi:hypothetical protein